MHEVKVSERSASKPGQLNNPANAGATSPPELIGAVRDATSTPAWAWSRPMLPIGLKSSTKSASLRALSESIHIGPESVAPITTTPKKAVSFGPARSYASAMTPALAQALASAKLSPAEAKVSPGRAPV
ncbi:hypothetical protein H632_c4363p0, partial [Helicosporidium sp. ATCC 50920]